MMDFESPKDPRPDLERYIEALKRIVLEQGLVCEEFMTCTHASCDSSYTSWNIADHALKGWKMEHGLMVKAMREAAEESK